MTRHERNVIQASHKAHEAYARLWTGPGENPAAVKAWHETYRRELEADYEATIADFEASYGRR